MKLSSDDQYITIVKDIADFGVIYPEKEATADFVVKASAATPDGHEVNFIITDVSANAGEMPWSTTFSVKVLNENYGESIIDINSAFNIYPNPVGDKLIIETDVKVEEIGIYDVFGRQQLAVSGQRSAISVIDLDAGVYFIKIKTENGEVTKRFIKK